MKKKLMGLFLLSSLSSYAGILENRSNGYEIEFDLDRDSGIVYVQSNSPGTMSGTYNLSSMKKVKDDFELFPIFTNGCLAIVEVPHDRLTIGQAAGCILIPVYNVLGLLKLTVDVVFLPIRGPVELINTMKENKDFNILKEAINSDKKIKVSNSRFERMEKLFN